MRGDLLPIQSLPEKLESLLLPLIFTKSAAFFPLGENEAFPPYSGAVLGR